MLETYYRIDQAAGVSINLLQNGNVSISACSVIVKDNQLEFGKKVNHLNNPEELNKYFPGKTYVALNMCGKGILHKQTERIEEVNHGNFTQILPNANFDDFYIQNFISGDKSFISVIRKTEADKWIGLLSNQGFTPLTLSFGPFPIQNIITQLNVYDQEIMFDGHIIQRNEQKEWTGYRYKENTSAQFPLKVESETIDEKLIIAYSVAFQLVLSHTIDMIQAGVNFLEIDFKKHVADKKFKVQSFLVLTVFFILLLINFFIFSWLNSSNVQLSDRISRSAQNTNDIQAINEQVKGKEQLIKDLGWDGGVNKSSLIDRLASLLPVELSWQEITINPVDQAAARAQRSLQFMDRKIRIVGNSEKIIPVNEWIARVKSQKWVKNIQLDSYTYNNELNTGQFTILIDY